MARLRYSSVVLVVVLVSGCREAPPDRARLAEGQEAWVHRKDASVVKVDTRKGEGLFGADYDYLKIGEYVVVMGDGGNEANPERAVTVAAQEGRAKGLPVRIARKNLRPRVR